MFDRSKPFRFASPARRSTFALAGGLLSAATLLPCAFAQQDAPAGAALLAANTTPSSSSSLPDSPGAVTSSSSSSDGMLRASLPAADAPAPPAGNVAHKHAKYIAADQTAQPITARDKVIIGAQDLYSASNFLAIVFSSGYEQLTDGQPNYGVNSTAFGKRIGAAAIRETSQGVFTDMIFSPLFHDDPRYYAKGDDVPFFHRVVYAATRVLVTRTDHGHATINAPLLVGYAASSALEPTYYPQINRNFKDVASGYGGSLGGAAIGFLFSEFEDDLLEVVHLKKKP